MLRLENLIQTLNYNIPISVKNQVKKIVSHFFL